MQHLFQWNTFVLQQRMTRRHCHHQWIIPCGFRDYSISNLVRLRKPHVVQIVQAFDLLRQRDLEQANLGFWFLLAAQRQECREPQWSDAVRQRDPQLPMKAIGSGFHTIARLLQGRKDARRMLQQQLSRAGL